MDGEHWRDKPEVPDFVGARSYLSLLVGPAAADKLSKALQKTSKLHHYAAKDLLRAAGLPLLAEHDSEVAADLKKVKSDEKLTPVLIVQGTPLWIADGYHQVCASYYIDEKILVPCRASVSIECWSSANDICW